MHPYLYTDDLEGGVYVPEDAVADPKAICEVLAFLAENGGAKYVEDTTINYVLTENLRVSGVKTNRGNVKCEYFVNCAGMWARELGLECTPQVRIPAYPAEHFYVTADLPNEEVTDNLPCVRDFDSYTYAREYNRGFMIGWFEPEAKPAFVDRKVPKDWKKYIKRDWKHIGNFEINI